MLGQQWHAVASCPPKVNACASFMPKVINLQMMSWRVTDGVIGGIAVSKGDN